jgi:hypothetical protein
MQPVPHGFCVLIKDQKHNTMKKLMIILLFITGVSLGASAQRHFSGIRHYPRSRVIISAGVPLYPNYGYYDPFYSPAYRHGYFPRESRLDVKIDDIKSDYQDRIWSARHDKSLSRAERKRTIHDLKYERDRAINEAKMNYYRTRR